MLLVLLALIGFSAVCFADPVLMVRRSNHDRACVTVKVPLPAALPQGIEQTPAWRATVALQGPSTPSLDPAWMWNDVELRARKAEITADFGGVELFSLPATE